MVPCRSENMFPSLVNLIPRKDARLGAMEANERFFDPLEDEDESLESRESLWEEDSPDLLRNGLFGRALEKLPILNNVMQALHNRAGDEESLLRARASNPLRASGRLARGAEHVPLLNNVMQTLHRATGRSEEFRRARRKNPLGANGYITKFGEHIPGLADTICCIHKFRGLDAEAERARAFSLHRMVGRKGAITQLAQLLPGTNLIAALLAEAKGDHREAVKALNLLKRWRDVASADGALARVAELLPGVDIISFGLMVNHGHYAHAVRAICKTRWVEITATSSALALSAGAMEDWVIVSVDSDMLMQPRAASLAGGLLDVCIHLLDFDAFGNQRWVTRGLEEELPSACTRKKRRGLRRAFEDVKITKANEALHGVLDYLFLSSPFVVKYMTELTNWAVEEWYHSSAACRMFYILCPPMVSQSLPSTVPSARFARAIQDSLPGVRATHGQMPLNPCNFQLPLRTSEPDAPSWKNNFCEAATGILAGMSCLSFSCLAAGVHSILPLACFTGCFAGVGAGLGGYVRKRVRSNIVAWFNKVNTDAWQRTSLPVVPLRTQVQDCQEAPQDPESPEPPPPPSVQFLAESLEPRAQYEAFEPQGIIFEWPSGLLEEVRAAEIFRDYILSEWMTPSRPLNWLHPLPWILHLLELPLRELFNDCFEDQVVPLVIPIELAAGTYSSGIWLPEIRVMLVLWMQFTDRRYVKGIEAVIVDGMLDQIANVVKVQLVPEDLREMDPRLRGFTEPVNLGFDVAIRWAGEEKMYVEFKDLKVRLGLPK
ncbi:hypothetical protein AK812_SmicGene35913 [Symbiodinium microadriaticum]|uniref:Uncharacterized protein n=1 Tax=Symbiodinium microadriaticum TaxID=2951 RepID=A0A1Q9CKB5_SYMMI|nr:hypothetical protein AK812_SmicGene35913 [Symbiodinium microadriaticum]